MITDKFNEYVYSQASRLFTKWRIACIILGVVSTSEKTFYLLESEFWSLSTSDAATYVFDIFTKVPASKFATILIIAFIIAPLSLAITIKAFIKIELERATELLLKVQEAIEKLDEKELLSIATKAKEQAVNANRDIQRKVGINQVFVFSALLAGTETQSLSHAIITLFTIILWMAIMFLETQTTLNTYANKIFYFKEIHKRLTD